ncbi:unnamed protein product [Phytophthora fragariaefolia]|uniref:Unnamed protein product n=1 Tax=Phytophthora fragariaefolia TaxID=1490495 RepID=A0A9W7CPC4_9STRA|nr:unnamed protein product [Phytophthora fragariaefolia]
MRPSCVLLLATAILVAFSDAAPSGQRLLRSHKTTHKVAAANEERGLLLDHFYGLLRDLFYRLPKQFQRMKDEPSYLEHILESWRTGLVDGAGARAYMIREGLKSDDVEYFMKLYKAHVEAKGGFLT